MPLISFYTPWKHIKQSFSKAVVRRCSVKKVFLKVSQNSEEITCARVSFLINLQSGTGIFLWIFLKNTSGGYFWLKFEWLNHQQILKFQFKRFLPYLCWVEITCEISENNFLYRVPLVVVSGFFDVSRVYRKGPVTWNGLMTCQIVLEVDRLN